MGGGGGRGPQKILVKDKLRFCEHKQLKIAKMSVQVWRSSLMKCLPMDLHYRHFSVLRKCMNKFDV